MIFVAFFKQRQFGGQFGQHLGTVRALDAAARSGIEPDLTFLLDCPPDAGLARARACSGSSDRFEQEALAFHEAVQRGFHALAAVAHRLPDRVMKRGATGLALTFPPPAGDDPQARLLAPSPFDVLRAILGLTSASPEEPFALALLGVIAFDHVDLFETLPTNAQDPLGFPDAIFWLASSLIVFDPGARPRLVCTAFESAGLQPGPEARLYERLPVG